MLPVPHACKILLLLEHPSREEGQGLVQHHPGAEQQEGGQGTHGHCLEGWYRLADTALGTFIYSVWPGSKVAR